MGKTGFVIDFVTKALNFYKETGSETSINTAANVLRLT
jgi:hypothetical protein